MFLLKNLFFIIQYDDMKFDFKEFQYQLFYFLLFSFKSIYIYLLIINLYIFIKLFKKLLNEIIIIFNFLTLRKAS